MLCFTERGLGCCGEGEEGEGVVRRNDGERMMRRARIGEAFSQ